MTVTLFYDLVAVFFLATLHIHSRNQFHLAKLTFTAVAAPVNLITQYATLFGVLNEREHYNYIPAVRCVIRVCFCRRRARAGEFPQRHHLPPRPLQGGEKVVRQF